MADTKDTTKNIEETPVVAEKETKASVETTTATPDVKPAETKDAASTEATPAATPARPNNFRRQSPPQRGGRGGGRPGGNRGRRGGGRFERQKPEFDQKIISIRRVTRVVSGGRRFAFSVSLVAGNKNGKVGVGIGKATDTALAIEKAAKNAKKNMVTIQRTDTKSIPHEVRSRFCSSDIFIKPAIGKGIVAGSSVRVVLDLAGVTDVSGKVFSRSKNKLNNAKATIKALQDLPKAKESTVVEKKVEKKDTPVVKKVAPKKVAPRKVVTNKASLVN